MPKCSRCRYDLRGLPDPVLRCPECGAEGSVLQGPTRFQRLSPYLLMCGPYIPLTILSSWLTDYDWCFIYAGLIGPTAGIVISWLPNSRGYRWPKLSPLVALLLNGVQGFLLFLLVVLMLIHGGNLN
jgi:hypothetical protein